MFRCLSLHIKTSKNHFIRWKSTSAHLANNDVWKKICENSVKKAETLGVKTFDVFNPLNGELIGKVADEGVKEVEQSIEKAHKAFKTWKKTPAKQRSRLLADLRAVLVEKHQQLAEILTLENGKPLQEAAGEVLHGADHMLWFSEEGKRVYGDVVQPTVDDRRCMVIKEPVGVCGMITPWNFPSAMVTRKISPAVVAGCTVVLKPSEETPYSALAVAHLAEEVGFPEGVFNVVTSSTSNTVGVGELVSTSPLVRKLSFTGSTQVGKLLMGQCQSNVKKLSMELGGNAPFVLFETADVNKAVSGLISSKFRSSGQTCVCPNRIYVHERLHDEFVSKLKEAMRSKLRLGDGFDPATTQGPLINAAAVHNVVSMVKDAVSMGAEVVLGGKSCSYKGGEKDCFVEPTLLINVHPDSFRDEIFGPVAPVFRFSDEKDVIEKANDTTSGLAGYFYSRDAEQMWRVSEALEYGMVAVNLGVMGLEQMPFGGVKESGFGREGSKYGMDDYLTTKAIHMGF